MCFNYHVSMSEKRRVGRPELPEAERRKNRSFTATDADWKLMQRAAKREGYSSVSDWIKDSLLAKARRVLSRKR